MSDQQAATPQEYAERQSELHELASRAEGLREYIISLDQRRQGNREASGSMKRKPPSEGKVWMMSGDIFIRLPCERAIKLVEDDSTNTSKEIDDARSELKAVAERIEALEGMGETIAKSFSNLKPLSREDMEYVKKGGMS